MSCAANVCQDCGDALIHQARRGAHESSSELGQFVHDNYGTSFYYMDIDALTYSFATGILRIIEHKKPGDSVRGSQRSCLPLMQESIEHLISAGRLAQGSGVFVLWMDCTQPDSAKWTRVSDSDWHIESRAFAATPDHLDLLLTSGNATRRNKERTP
jgi:hypothetical protein